MRLMKSLSILHSRTHIRYPQIQTPENEQYSQQESQEWHHHLHRSPYAAMNLLSQECHA